MQGALNDISPALFDSSDLVLSLMSCSLPPHSPLYFSNTFGINYLHRQGLWKFVAYGDVGAAMNALPRANETLDGAWTRMDLLYESDTEDLSIDPGTLKKCDSECFPFSQQFNFVPLFWRRRVVVRSGPLRGLLLGPLSGPLPCVVCQITTGMKWHHGS